MPAKSVLAFRIRDELREELAQLAKKDRRTVSQYVENALEDHVRAATTQKLGRGAQAREGKPLRR